MTSTDVSTQMDADEKIIFPTDGLDRVSPIPTSAPACYKDTFCENVADYPRQLVNAAIARNASLRFLETIDPVNSLIFKSSKFETCEKWNLRNKSSDTSLISLYQGQPIISVLITNNDCFHVSLTLKFKHELNRF